jgi:hypothetical protein
MIQFSDTQLSKAHENACNPVNKSNVLGSYRHESPTGHSGHLSHPAGTAKCADASCVSPEIPEDISNAMPSAPQKRGISRSVATTQQSCRLVDKTPQREASAQPQRPICRRLKFTDPDAVQLQNRKIDITMLIDVYEECFTTILRPPLEQSGDPLQIPQTSRLLASNYSLYRQAVVSPAAVNNLVQTSFSAEMSLPPRHKTTVLFQSERGSLKCATQPQRRPPQRPRAFAFGPIGPPASVQSCCCSTQVMRRLELSQSDIQ